MTKRTLAKIENWANSNGFNIPFKFDNDFYYLDGEYIAIAKKYDSTGDNYFKEILHELGLKENYSGLTLSILHELGHYNTLNKLTNKAYDKCNEKLDTLYNAKLTDKKFYKAYYNVKSEKLANKWLVKYANTHKKEIEKLEKLLDK